MRLTNYYRESVEKVALERLYTEKEKKLREDIINKLTEYFRKRLILDKVPVEELRKYSKWVNFSDRWDFNRNPDFARISFYHIRDVFNNPTNFSLKEEFPVQVGCGYFMKGSYDKDLARIVKPYYDLALEALYFMKSIHNCLMNINTVKQLYEVFPELKSLISFTGKSQNTTKGVVVSAVNDEAVNKIRSSLKGLTPQVPKKKAGKKK